MRNRAALPPPIKTIVVNGKKKVAVNGVVELNIPTPQQQSDWNQNDENAPGFIKNRICYDEGDKILLTGNVIINSATNYSFDAISDVLPEPTLGSKLYLKFSSLNEIFETVWTQGSVPGFMFNITSLNGGCGGNYGLKEPNKIDFNGGGGGASIPFSEGDTFTLFEKNIQPISEDFISDTIARASQLGGVQFKIDDTNLQASLDGGSTWKTVTLS